ncbi:MAG: beta-ketoacyl-ACP synthase II [Phycisphaerae bacterium]|nr:beta-ketoacyl-ACP synthase II [Phycisphaerae bacterium]
MSTRRVVITGMGVISPLGDGLEPFWDGLVAGRSGIAPIARFDASEFDTRFGGECREFEPDRYLDRKQTKRLDRFAQLALVAAQMASRDSGIAFEQEDGRRVGVIIGSGIGGLAELESQHKRLLDKGPTKVSAFTIPKLMLNAASGNISILVGACGPSTAVATACASATNAMGDAYLTIKRDEADVMFTGGSEAALTPLGLAAFCAMHALSTRNDDPAGASRPFEKSRDGFVMGEGAGIVLFEELEHARARGARIYAELLGFGASSDAGHITQPMEDGAGAAEAMRQALTDARLAPDDIDYINAHGTATILGDIAETRAVKTVFGDHARRLAISSTKSCVGHLLGASGGVELAATIMAIQHGVAPPTINLDEPDPECDLDYVPNTARDMQIDRAMSNSFGFGGHNACVIVGRYQG